MSKVYRATVSLKDLRQLNKDILDYKNHYLPQKEEELLEALSDAGIRIARANCGEFGSFIGFVKMVNRSKYNYKCSAILTGYNAVPNIVEWVYFDGIKRAEVSSILMAEFGSGQHSEPPRYRGTFPDQKHADEPVWFYATETDGNGHPINWKANYGVKPTMPMYRAWLEMLMDVRLIGRRVFNT